MHPYTEYRSNTTKNLALAHKIDTRDWISRRYLWFINFYPKVPGLEISGDTSLRPQWVKTPRVTNDFIDGRM